jgi:hypothetical protein
MKNFVVKDLEKFLEIADIIKSPFKFYEVINWYQADKEVITIRASFWIRTVLLSLSKISIL